MKPFSKLPTQPQLTAETFYKKGMEVLDGFDIYRETQSVLGRPIRAFVRGRGGIRVLIWTQMHGDESASTFAVIDFLHDLQKSTKERFWDSITLCIVPILNPDGAAAYTRHNALGVDLNRDARHLTCPESSFLVSLASEFKPHWAFNMHDQRTIFAAGETNIPATLALLAPSVSKEYTGSVMHRKRAIALIGSAVLKLPKPFTPNISRFDDTFYPLAMGDFFQEQEIATILVEVGGGEHILRHSGRSLAARFLKEALSVILDPDAQVWHSAPGTYESLPPNINRLRDIIFTNANIDHHQVDVAVQLRYNPKRGAWDMVCDTVGKIDYYGAYICIDLSDSPSVSSQQWRFVIGETFQLPSTWETFWKAQNIASYQWVYSS